MLSVEILEAVSGCKVTPRRPPEVAPNANAAMNAAEEPHPLMAGENIVRGVVSFLDFKGVEAFAQLCKFRAWRRRELCCNAKGASTGAYAGAPRCVATCARRTARSSPNRSG